MRHVYEKDNTRLFMYIDILGFSKLMKCPRKIESLFRIIDGASLHRDSNFKVISFSDTVLIYNKYSNQLSPKAKATELMYLIELGQDLMRRLNGYNIYFRGLITEGAFKVQQLENMQSYYGQALVDTYNDERGIQGIGVFCDKKLRHLNQSFKAAEFSPKYDFIYTTQMLTRYEYSLYPINPEFLVSADLQYLLYPEVVHLIDILKNSRKQTDPKIKIKYVNTWRMYELAYPELTQTLDMPNFDYSFISDLDWTPSELLFKTNKKYYARKPRKLAK